MTNFSKLQRILAYFVVAFIFHAPVKSSASESCASLFSPNKLRIVNSANKTTVALGESFVELMGEIRKDSLSITYEKILNALPSINLQLRESGPWFNEHLPEPSEYYPALNLTYSGSFRYGDHFLEQRVPYTKYNRLAAKKLAQAFLLMDMLVYQPNEKKYRKLMESHLELLRKSTFSKADIRQHFDFALASLGAALMQLTAEPVEGLTPRQLMLHLTSDTKSGSPNLLVQLSLSLGPSVLGAYGASHYVGSPLLYENGQLAYTPHFRSHLRNTKQVWHEIRDDQVSYEHGKGCPAGRCVGIEKRIPLQDLLDSVMHIYKALNP